ncbi:MAG: hypothetical protein OEV36_01350 [Myxococcales bacterium]|nr:hypothetical protein [Myxococcales bacterium]
MKSMRPITALRAIRKLFANPDETEHVFEIIEALQATWWARQRSWRSAITRRETSALA